MEIIKWTYGSYLIVTPSKRVFIWDTGLENVARNWSLPYILRHIRPIQTDIIISHWHHDTHTAALPRLLANDERLKFGELYTSGVYSSQRPEDIPTKDASLAALTNLAKDPKFIKRGDKINDQDLTIEILSPCSDIQGDIDTPGEYTDNPNRVGAVVAKFTFGDFSLLMTGDRGQQMLTDTLSLAANANATVMQAPHHGAIGDISQDHIDIVQPELVVFSSAPQTSNDTKEFLENQDIDVIRMGPLYAKPLKITANFDGSYTTKRLFWTVPYPRGVLINTVL